MPEDFYREIALFKSSVSFADSSFIKGAFISARYDAPLQKRFCYIMFSKGAPDGTSRSRASCRVEAKRADSVEPALLEISIVIKLFFLLLDKSLCNNDCRDRANEQKECANPQQPIAVECVEDIILAINSVALDICSFCCFFKRQLIH